jgi:uncharacterized membrane protein YoaT (DUF817 family)
MHCRQLTKQLLGEIGAFVILVASVVFLWRNGPLLFLVALAEALAGMALWHERYDLSFFAVIAVLGSLAEVVFVHFGVWHYANPTFAGVPLWFPFAFGTCGLIGSRLARTITEIWGRASPLEAPRG